MKLTPIHLVWKKPRLFIPLFAPGLLTTSSSLLNTPEHWGFLILNLGSAFVISVTLTESISTGKIDDNWGSLTRRDNPRRYWAQISVWVTMYLVSIVLPLLISLPN